MAIVFHFKKAVAGPSIVEPPKPSSGKDVIKGHIRAAVAQRMALRRMDKAPRLSREEELNAIAAFLSTKGVTVCPTVHLVAEDHIGYGRTANTLMRDRMKAAGL